MHCLKIGGRKRYTFEIPHLHGQDRSPLSSEYYAAYYKQRGGVSELLDRETGRFLDAVLGYVLELSYLHVHVKYVAYVFTQILHVLITRYEGSIRLTRPQHLSDLLVI